jgi:hypothetical protein
MPDELPPRLLDMDQVCRMLSCEPEDVQWLVDAGQLTEVRMHGKRRFVFDEVQELIATYRRIQRRRRRNGGTDPNASTSR